MSKNEKMFYELAMQMHDVDQRVWSMSSHMLALGVALKVDPKKMAEILTGDQAVIKQYAEQINDEIRKIDEAKTPEQKAQEHAGHDHTGHDHNH